MNQTKDFKPYIPASKITPEFTITSIIMGVLLAIIFGGANAYQAGQYQPQGQYMPQGQISQPVYQPQAQMPQPMYQPQAQYQQGAPQNNAQQIDPITGRPMLAGGIMGL